MGYVYFIGELSGGPVKIGHTGGCVHQRLRGLQTAYPAPLGVLLAVEGTADMERRFHSICGADRLSGEWFKRGAVVGRLMEALAAALPEEGIIDKQPRPQGRAVGECSPDAAAPRKVGRPPKAEKDQPWIAAGLPRETYYRHLRAGGARPRGRPRLAEPCPWLALGISKATYYRQLKTRET